MDSKIIFRLFFFIIFLIPTHSYAIEFKGKFLQGHFIVGITNPSAKIIIDKKEVKVSKDGFFAFGIDRDRKFDLTITKIQDGKKEKIVKKVLKRKYNIQRIDGLEESKVTPPESVYNRIKEENKKIGAPLGTIFMDSVFTPIKNVKYTIEDFRVEQKTDYEKLVFEIITDGSIDPKNALTEGAKVLIHHFMLFSDERITLEADEIAQTETYDEESLHMRQLLKTRLIDMDLSVRALNCLKAAEVDTLGDLVSFNKSDLMKFRNFGKKSLTELEELVDNKGLTFGMDLSKYNLD